MSEVWTHNIFANEQVEQQYCREACIVIATILATLFVEHFIVNRRTKNGVTHINQVYKDLSTKDDQLTTGIDKRHNFIKQLDLLSKGTVFLCVVIAIACYMSQGFYNFIT